jgi:large subunit ribosomal protein L21
MKKYAVVALGGKQYKVSEGQELLVDKLDSQDPKPDVLLIVDGETVKLGNPTVKDAKVVLQVLDEELKGKKLRVFKYKPKSRYRKTKGFRARFSKLLVKEIS